MLARASILVPIVLVCSFGPGFVFVRRLRWHPLEKVAGSIALSLSLIFLLTFGAYWAGLPASSAYYGITALIGLLSLLGAWDAWRLLRSRVLGDVLVSFGMLVVWTLGAQSLIRHYSGGDWCCDWVEHYQRSLFFLERWPVDFLFIGRYPVTARPPFMNVITAYFLGTAGREFALYQIVFSLLNLLVFFPCCLFARRFAPKVRRLPVIVAIFLACNPMFFMNTTFPWTKVLAAFFVVLALWFYLAGWRKHDPVRTSAGFLSVMAGTMVHFSSAPYAVLLAAMYVTTVWPRQPRRARALAIAVLPAAAFGGLWIAWSLSQFGAGSTFLGNVTVQNASALTFGDNLVRIGLNTWHTFWPYLFPGSPADSALRLLTDRAFTFYQENFLGAIGSLNAYATLWLLVSARWWRPVPVSKGEWRFWFAFIPLAIMLGIAVDSETTLSGFANICLQPLVYFAVTFVAARFVTLTRPIRILLWCGLLVDFVLGIVLELHMESQLLEWARTPNWDLKREGHFVFAGDLLRRFAPSIEFVLVAAAVGMFWYLGRVTLASTYNSAE